MNPFVHLHLHSCYSLLDGACRIDELLDDAVKMNMPAMALTDHGVLYGAVEFYEKAKQRGIKAILGCEIYVAPRTRFDKTPKLDENPYHLVVLAENETGYRNLLQLVSLASLEGFYYRPRVDKELLSKHSKGLTALSACLAGEVPEAILKSGMPRALEAAAAYRDIFGQGNFFLEIQDHNLQQQQEVNRGLFEIQKKINLPFVATNDVHYTRKTHAQAHDVLLCIQTGKKVEEKNRLRFETEEFYLKGFEELEPRFREFPEAMQNTLRIAERCSFNLSLSETSFLPTYPISDGFSEQEFLRKLCFDGISRRYEKTTPAILSRLEQELTIINSMGFADYFLIVWDFVKHAKEKNIPVGPGRGSVAGSLVAYLLEITEVDPIRYNLLFERFLNPGRKKLPDIDIDFCDLRRDEMIRYVVEKYGRERVAQIVTFGTLRARAAVRDAGRVLSLPIPDVDRIAKVIPSRATIAEAKELPEIQNLMRDNAVLQRLVETAEKIEGLPRNASVHAAGVVIAKDALMEHVALQKMQGNVVVCQYEMGAVEKVGLLKMDFLGLRTLTVLDETRKLIQSSRGTEIQFAALPLNDKKTFRLLSEASTVGVFQLESQLAQQILREYKPERFSDVVAIMALTRPGPLQSGMVSEFIKARRGKSRIQFPHPLLEAILKETYGIFLYQEQVMQTAVTLAGFSMVEADALREAMGKKKVELMAQYREKFFQGGIARGIPESIVSSIWETMDKFALYGFNKSHSAAYGLVSYWTAYLKANFPVEFMAATLTSVGDKTEKVSVMMNECRRMGIEVLPPDIQESATHFTVVGNRIRFGLGAIRNVGEKAIEEILEARKSGPFSSFQDFCCRVDSRTVNRRVLESLIKAGALDSLGWGRAKLLANLEEAMENASNLQKVRSSGQTSFFGSVENFELPEFRVQEVAEFSKEKLLLLEREMLGLYLSDHPINEYQQKLTDFGVMPIVELARSGEKPVLMAGAISQIRRIVTKNNQTMAFITLEDQSGQAEGVIFSKVYEKCRSILTEGSLVVVRGKTSVKEEETGEDEEPRFEVKVLAEEVLPITVLQREAPAEDKQNEDFSGRVECHIALDLAYASVGVLPRMKEILQEDRGSVPVFLNIRSQDSVSTIALSPHHFVKDVSSIRRKMTENFGSAVQVEFRRKLE